MAWTTPITWVPNQVPTATELNTNLRDNLLKTLPSVASVDDSYFIVTDTNTLEERQWDFETIPTEESTSSSSYTDLSTPGPSVTLETTEKALVIISANLQRNTTSDQAGALMGVEVSGATSFSPSPTEGIKNENSGSGNREKQIAAIIPYTNLNPGTNTFTAKYRIWNFTGTATYKNRTLIVLPF